MHQYKLNTKAAYLLRDKSTHRTELTVNQNQRQDTMSSKASGSVGAAPGCCSGLQKLLASMARRVFGRWKRSDKHKVHNELEGIDTLLGAPSAVPEDCSDFDISPSSSAEHSLIPFIDDSPEDDTLAGGVLLESPQDLVIYFCASKPSQDFPHDHSDILPSPSAEHSLIPFIDDSAEEDTLAGELLLESPQDLVIYFCASKPSQDFSHAHSSVTESLNNDPGNPDSASQQAQVASADTVTATHCAVTATPHCTVSITAHCSNVPAHTVTATIHCSNVPTDAISKAVCSDNTYTPPVTTPEPHQQEGEDAEGWRLVTNKKSKNKKKKTPFETQTPAAVQGSTPQGGGKGAKDRGRRQHRDRQQHRDRHQGSRDRVRLSWAEDTVRTVLQVPPNRRRYVIGARGEMVLKLRQQYPSVRVTVPPLDDHESQQVNLEGLKSQVTAAARDITTRLLAVEAQLREAAARRRAAVRELQVQVAPHMRRHVVGPGGEALRSLTQEFPAVRVTVPPPTDTRTGTVTIRGPPAEAAAVQRRILTSLQAGQRPRQPRRGRRVPGAKAAATPAP